MEFLNIFLDVVKNKYADFNGRARRKEYWSFVLVNIIIGFVFGILGAILSLFTYIGYIVSLALLLPGVAIGVRRLHDVGKSGWFLLIALIPFGAFYLLYLFVQEGTSGSNEFGANPKEVAA